MNSEPVNVTDIHICLTPPESCSPTPRSRESTFLHEKEEEKCCSARKTKEILPNSTKANLFQDDIFCNQKVHLGNCHRWSRYLVTDTRGLAKVSAIPTKIGKTWEKNIRYCGHTVNDNEMNVVDINLPIVNIGQTGNEMQMKEEAKTRENKTVQQETEKTKAEIHSNAQQELQKRPTWRNIIQIDELDEFEDIAVLAEEMIEAVEEPRKDKSIRRRFLNWLSNLLEDHYAKKIARTYMREAEDGDQIYRTSYMAPPTTRAKREQRKRQKLIYEDMQRQWVKNLIDSYWKVQRKEKELLRVKEEECYEKSAGKHGLSVLDSSPEQPNKRMSKWEKRFLRAKELFSR